MAVFTYPALSVASTLAPGASTEAKQDDQITELQAVNTDLDTLVAVDYATETTLSGLNAKVTAVDTTGKATEAKQDSAIVELQQIEADVEAGNALLTTIDADTSTIAGDTTSIDGKITAVDTGNVTIASSALPTGASTSANQTTANASLSSIESDITSLNARLAGNLVPETFDYIAITYVAAGNGAGEIETVTYKTGGAAGSTVATLTLAYDGSNNLSSVTRS